MTDQDLSRFYLPTPVGRVAAAADAPSTAAEFTLWAVDDQNDLDVGKIVAVVDRDHLGNELGVIFAVVEEPTRKGQYPVLLDYLTHDGQPDAAVLTNTPAGGGTVLTFTCRVLHSTTSMFRPAPPGPVYWASAEGIAEATGVRRGPGAIPFGVIDNGPAGLCPVYLDQHYLVTGRESAHMLISGKSGLAAKSSAFTTLIRSVLTNTTEPQSVILVNTKGSDLIFGDIGALPADDADRQRRAAAGIPAALTDDDLAIYAAMGLEPAPFPTGRYRVWAPMDDTGRPLTERRHPTLTSNVTGFQWGLEHVLPYLGAVLGDNDQDPKFDALLADVRSEIKRQNLASFNELGNWFDQTVMGDVDSNGRWRFHDGATCRKAQNRLMGLPTRLRGLVAKSRPTAADVDLTELRDGDVWVIDVAQLDDTGQVLVLTRLLEELRRGREQHRITTNVAVMVDEAGRLIPKSGAEGPLRRLTTVMREMSERSRHLGLSLFLGGQLASKLDERTTANLATVLIGNTSSAELDASNYSRLPASVKRKVAGLPKGEYLAYHPKLFCELFIKLPRPSILPAEDARRLYASAAEVDRALLLQQTAEALGVSLSHADATRAIAAMPLAKVRQLCDDLIARAPAPARFPSLLDAIVARLNGGGLLDTAHAAGETLLPDDPTFGRNPLDLLDADPAPWR